MTIERSHGLIFVYGPNGFFAAVDTEEKLARLLARREK